MDSQNPRNDMEHGNHLNTTYYNYNYNIYYNIYYNYIILYLYLYSLSLAYLQLYYSYSCP